jgi:hypothetical protein
MASLSVLGCSEEETLTGANTEQQDTQPDETQGQPAPSAQPQAPAGALSQQPAPSGGTSQPQAGQPASGEQIEIAGTVEETPEGYTLQSPTESYRVEGEDMAEMVGKQVRIKGSLQESEGMKTISVEDVTVVE